MWRVGTITLLALLASVAIFAGPDLAAAGWQPVGGPLNGQSADGHDLLPRIAGVGGDPHVAWYRSAASPHRIDVSHLAGDQWAAIGGFQTPGAEAGPVSDIIDYGNRPAVAWAERAPGGRFQIRVAVREDGTWKPIGGNVFASSTRDATDPSLAHCGDTLCLAWSEYDGNTDRYEVFMRYLFSGSYWAALSDDPLNFDPEASARRPVVGSVGGQFFVAWVETPDDIAVAGKVHAAQWTGSWTHLGSGENAVMHSTQGTTEEVSAATSGSVLYLGWAETAPTTAADDDESVTETQAHVSRYDFDQHLWRAATPNSPINNPNRDALDVDLAMIGDRLHVAYIEDDGGPSPGLETTLFVKRLSSGGLSWAGLVGADPIDRGPDRQDDVTIAGVAGVPHVGWAEYMGEAGWQIFVSRFVNDLSSSQPPSIAGIPKAGNQLTCSPGTWTHDASFSYLWERAARTTTAEDDPAWGTIDGASGTHYTVQEDDVGSNVRCRVVASDASNISEAVSRHLRVDTGPPVMMRAPHVSGDPIAGHTLTCDPGDWTTGSDFAYQWVADTNEIPGATSATYVVRGRLERVGGHSFDERDIGTFLKCRVTASNDVGAVIERSDNPLLAVQGKPTNVANPTIVHDASRTNPADELVRCDPGTWTDDYSRRAFPGYEYEFAWLRAGEVIAGENAARYLTRTEDLGKALRCRVISVNVAGRGDPAESPEYQVPLPKGPGVSPGRMLTAQGKNEFVPTNVMTVGAEYERATQDYARARLTEAIGPEITRCKTYGDWRKAEQEPKPTPARVVADNGVVDGPLRCRILFHHGPGTSDPQVDIRADGVWWRPPSRPADEFDMGFGIPPVDPTKPLPIDAALQASIASVTPTQIIWDVDNDGRTDATCPGSAPVLRALFEPGHWTPHGIVVYPNSAQTGIYSEARGDFYTPADETGQGAGEKRPGQPFACRTSIEQPPEPQAAPCITEGTMGRVHVVGNLCPINVRTMERKDIKFIKERDPDLYNLLGQMAKKANDDDPDARAVVRAMAPPDGIPELLPRAFLDPTTSSVGSTIANNASSYASFKPDGELSPGLEPPAIPAQVQTALPKLDAKHGQFAMDQMYIARGDIKVNGVLMQPRDIEKAGLFVPGDASQGLSSVKSMRIALPDVQKKLGELVLEEKGKLNATVEDKINGAKTELINRPIGALQNGVNSLKFGPFDFSGNLSIKLQPDGTASLTATTSIPFVGRFPGGGGALKTTATLNADRGGRITLQGFQFEAPQAYLGFMKIEHLFFRYENGITIRGKIQFPVPPANPAIDIKDFRLGPGGEFQSLRVELQAGAGSGIPVGPGIFLTSVEAGWDNRIKRLDGGAGISVGPSPGGGCPTLGINSHFDITFAEVVRFHAGGVANVACFDLFDVQFNANSTGYVTIEGGWNFDEGPLHFGVRLGGSMMLPNWQIEFSGRGGVRVPFLGDLEIQGVLGNRGLAACGGIRIFAIGRIRAGAGVRFSDGRPPLSYPELLSNLRFFTGCDLSSWKSLPARVRAAQAGGGQSFDVDEPGRGVALSFDGPGETPRVRLRSPSGKVYDFGDAQDGKTIDNAVAIPVDAEDRTVVLIGKPEAGRWTAEPVEGSPTIVRIERANILPAPRVKASVGGIGSSRILRYSVQPIEGQVVRLVEDAKGAQKPLRTVKGGGRGTVRFQTSEADGARRKIVAQVTQDGLPRDNITVASFSAPSPKVGRARRLRVRRSGRRAVVSWRRAIMARSYDVVVTSGDGQIQLMSPKGNATKVTVPGVTKGEGLVVRVIGISRAGRRGPAAGARLKGSLHLGARKPRKARRRRPARRS